MATCSIFNLFKILVHYILNADYYFVRGSILIVS